MCRSDSEWRRLKGTGETDFWLVENMNDIDYCKTAVKPPFLKVRIPLRARHLRTNWHIKCNICNETLYECFTFLDSFWLTGFGLECYRWKSEFRANLKTLVKKYRPRIVVKLEIDSQRIKIWNPTSNFERPMGAWDRACTFSDLEAFGKIWSRI